MWNLTEFAEEEEEEEKEEKDMDFSTLTDGKALLANKGKRASVKA